MELIAYSNSFVQNLVFEIPEEKYTCEAAAKKHLQTYLTNNINWFNVSFVKTIDKLPKKHQKKELRKLINK